MKKIQNNSGAILIVTAGFVLIFTMLGFASLYFATLQNELAEKQKNSTQAFWLADGALEIAKNHLPAGPNESFVWSNKNVDHPETNHVYDLLLKKHVDYNPDGTIKHQYKFKWKADSFAEVNGQKREIEAFISKFKIPDDPVASKNPITEIPDTIVLGPSQNIEVDPGLSTQEALNKTKNDLKELAVNSGNYFEDEFEDSDNLIYVDVKNTNSIYVTQEDILSSIVVINTTQANQNGIIPKVITNPGKILRGIVLVIGNAELVNPDIKGIVLADGQLTLSGSGQIINDPELIDQALEHLGASMDGSPKVIGWQEIVPKAI